MRTHALEGWSRSGQPEQLFRRFTFDNYAQTRRFLEAVGRLADTCGVSPQNINFGTTYVNITVAPAGSALSEAECDLAQQIGDCVDQLAVA
jgi:pterin-4a-carbinolamine dehydratase